MQKELGINLNILECKSSLSKELRGINSLY